MGKGQRLWVPPWGHSYLGYNNSGQVTAASVGCPLQACSSSEMGMRKKLVKLLGKSGSQSSAGVHTDLVASAPRACMKLSGQRPAREAQACSLDSTLRVAPPSQVATTGAFLLVRVGDPLQMALWGPLSREDALLKWDQSWLGGKRDKHEKFWLLNKTDQKDSLAK